MPATNATILAESDSSIALPSIAAPTASIAAPIKTLVEAINNPSPTPSRPVTPPASEKELLLQQELESLEIVIKHAEDPENWTRRTAYSLVTDDYRIHHLTAGTLRGDGKLGVKPALFQSKDQLQVLSVLHVGTDMCGHPNITHGGLLATLLDEITAMTAIPNLPGKTGFTANLNINYRHPCIADQFLVAHSEVTSVEGRKAFVKATLKTVSGTLLADATALFVAPRVPVSQITEQLTQDKNAAAASNGTAVAQA
ncbi:Thioesterase/thiol ester dehydrase-isomerase [Linnemannia elongata AG-77]|uniref:Thioesterase/thiol ester dehydrase-isomerase n=1 Tax=Linnemannia elongata AG-77 TaxID=1314771 RepID=A0A197JR21_9FUNG|nr:Thioesterase/thiol ester dehydrase-isomerase [Linnemannia elongata AG-77]